MTTFNGTTASDTLTGSSQSDYLAGLAGNDSLSGGSGGHDTLDGGTGSDTLDGGGGNDTYVVDSSKDVIRESGFDASDRIQASISIDLNSAAYDRIEHVTLTGTSGLSATGDEFANMLIGNGGANTLDGRGGADTMLGSGGNDTYEVDSSSDAVIELSGDGTDQVDSAASFALSDFVENLTLTGTAGIDGTGNALANKITGNDAANRLSGADGDDTLTGNGGDDTLDGGIGADSLSGGKGNDTYEVDDSGDKIAESGGAADVDTVESTITYVLGSNLEKLTLLGTAAIDGTGNNLNNALLGNDKANTLSGLAGNDTLNGEGGRDLLMGGAGNDGIVGERDGDTLAGGSGNDIFIFGLSGSKSDVIADFNGLPGADLIDLSDLLPGSITAATAGQFLQTVSAGGSTTLRIDVDGGNSFVDLAVLQGVTTDVAGLLANGDIHVFSSVPPPTAVVGTAGADTLAAGRTSELVEGLGGNDSLSGGNGFGLGFDTLDGGTGNDTMAGGKGSDTYIVDSAKDVIIESAGADDRVVASISIDLRNTAYDGIEHVTLTGSSPLSATGDAVANMLIGNIAANKLDGGANADTMIGGGGNDTYTVDNSGDSVVELDGDGTDQVNSSASFILPDFVEKLTLTGTADIDGTGNALANTITGNGGRNELDGRGGNDTLTGDEGADTLDGGNGADSLTGGNGGDRYVVDDPGDKISETGASTDTDTVVASVSYALGATLENLVLDGTAAIDGTGNALANVITGNAAANVLSGLAGNDIINGGGGDSLFGGDGSDLLIGNGDVLVG
ncbi:MAG TPA: calcium-binding protein, partial [Methylomirabilota bacterium]|nr:calcium-binding protein [Methylomirabilota bacterium]